MARIARDVASLDEAMEVATCFAAHAEKATVHIYGTTDEKIANPESGERYLVLNDEDVTRHHLRPEWEKLFTITAHRGRADQ